MKEQRTNKERAIRVACVALLLCVTAVWGFGIIVTDVALKGDMGVCTMLAGRFSLAAVVLFFVRLCLKKTKYYRPLTKTDIAAGAIVGIVNFFGFFSQSVGLLYTDTAKSGMLTGVYVVLVPVVHCVSHKKFRLKPLLNGALMMIGMLFLFDIGLSGKGNFNRGDAITLLGACFFAAQIILVDRFSGKVNVFNFTACQMLTMGVAGALGALAFERRAFLATDWGACLPAVLYLGILSSAFAYITQAWAQHHVSPSLAAVLLGLESLASVLFSLAFGQTGWSLHLAIGCAVMAAASILAATGESREQNKAVITNRNG